MKTVSYERLINKVVRKCGFELDQFTEDEIGVVNEALDTAVRFAYEYYQWPELMGVTAVTPVQLEGVDGKWVIEHAEVLMGTIDAVYAQNPLGSGGQLGTIDHQWFGGHLLVDVGSADELFVEHRLVEPKLDALPYDDEKEYQVNDCIVWPELSRIDGGALEQEIYRCVSLATSGQSPQETPEKWDLVEIPAIFLDYAADYAHAAWLEQDGQGDKARRKEAKAEGWLYVQVDRVDGQTGKPARWFRQRR